MEENTQEIVDQTVLAEDLSSKIKYEFRNQFLVKPLDPIMVEKEFSTPVAKDTTVEDGVEATNYDDVATEIKKVESDFRKGVVLKIPSDYINQMNDTSYPSLKINVGDVIVYNNKARYFDLLKDTQLVDNYNIIAVVR